MNHNEDPTNKMTQQLPVTRKDDTPIDTRNFWKLAGDWESIEQPPIAEVESALQRLGPLPFPRGGFPLMGLFATIYDHVVNCSDSSQKG